MFCNCDHLFNCIIEFQNLKGNFEQCNRRALCEECFFKKLAPILFEKYQTVPHISHKLQPFCATYAQLCEECTYESIELAEISFQE